VRFRALQQLFGWLGDEEELEVSPMAKMKPPLVPQRATGETSPTGETTP
jgi:hypothetical protein